MDISVDVAVTTPDRQLEGILQQQMDDDQQDADQETAETAVKMFNLEAVAGQMFRRQKKSVGSEVDEDADDEEDINPLAAVLEVELDEDNEVKSENMEDWLKKLHIRTQHLVGKVTLNGMSRLAATNNVATALTRFKGKVRVDNSGKRAASDGNSNGDSNSAEEGQQTTSSESPEIPTTPTEMSKDVAEIENPNKESYTTAVRSKRDVKPSSKAEPKTPRIRNKETSSPNTSGTKAASSEIRHKTASRTSQSTAGLATKTIKVKSVKSARSGIKSKVH